MRDYRFQALAAAPKIVERVLRAYPRDRFDERPHDESLTSREIVALLADAEQVVLDRIRIANNQPGSTVEWHEPAVRAKEKHYADKDPFHEGEVYESRRQTTLEYLAGMTQEDFQKTVTLEGHGTYSVSDYLTIVLAHDMERIAELTEFLANEVATIG